MNHFKHTQLKKLSGAALGALALMSAMPAMAAVIDFESIGPATYNGTETFSESGYTMTVLDTPASADGTGFAGAIGNGSDPYLCAIAACPVGNSSNYYLGVNDGGLKVARGDSAAFNVSSIDYAFLAPLGGLPSNSYGQLTLLGTLASGGTISVAYDFPLLNPLGNSPFVTASLGTAFGNAGLSSLVISACLFDGAGGCYRPLAGSENQAQFAFDNLSLNAVTAVPEADTYAMMGLGLGLVGLLSRRRANAGAKALAKANAVATINA